MPSTNMASNGPSANKTKICVYCGSSPGTRPEHMDTARSLARVMAANNIGLVYGGGTVGMMGELARTLVQLSGPESVHGIIPEALVKYERDDTYTSNGTASDNATLAVPSESVYGKTTVVKDMHTRKQLMVREVIEGGPGSGFIALSGGYGTIEELFETTTWNQLGIHDKGICILNINGFFDGLLSWINMAVEEGYIREGNAKIISQATDAEGAVKALREYKVAPTVMKLAWGST